MSVRNLSRFPHSSITRSGFSVFTVSCALRAPAAFLAGALAISSTAALAEADLSLRPAPPAAGTVATQDGGGAAAPQPKAASADAASRPRRAGAHLEKQTAAVKTGCFPGRLVAVLDRIGAHFGGEVIVTSGHRSRAENRRAGGARGSLHVACLAADVQIAGVAPSAIARYARAQPEVGGVGTYGHTRSVHVDIGARKFAWRGLSGHKAGRIRLAMR